MDFEFSPRKSTNPRSKYSTNQSKRTPDKILQPHQNLQGFYPHQLQRRHGLSSTRESRY